MPALTAAQQLIHSTKMTLFALVDGMQYERYFGEELSAQRYVSLPLFDTPDSRIAFAGPWIIQLSRVMDFRDKLCELEATLPSVSWIVSSSTLAELAAHFRKNMNIGLPDGRAALLRFGPARSGSSGNDAGQPATPGTDRFNTGMADNGGRKSLVT